jgi:hypothetical protein
VVLCWEGGEWDGVVRSAKGGEKMIDALARDERRWCRRGRGRDSWMVKHYLGDDSGHKCRALLILVTPFIQR